MKSSRPSAQGFAENSPDATYDPFVAEGGIPPAQGTPLLSPSTRISATLDVSECFALDAPDLGTEAGLWPLHIPDAVTSPSQVLSDNAAPSPIFCERDQTSWTNPAFSEHIATGVVQSDTYFPRAEYCTTEMEIPDVNFSARQCPFKFEDSLNGRHHVTGEKRPHVIIQGIVHEAAADFTVIPVRDAVIRSYKRRSLSEVVETCFELSGVAHKSATHLLHSFITCFFENFYNLWPISWRQGFDYDLVEPFLYLTMTSIGAMYAGSSHATAYGMAVHQALRPILLNLCLKCPENSVKMEEIFEALILTEVMSLYVGQIFLPNRPTNGVLVLFVNVMAINLKRASPSGSAWREDGGWPSRFCGVKLNFSILFNTLPLVSHLDFDLKIPCSQELWAYVGPDWREKLLTASQAPNSYTLYADLIRTATDGTFANFEALDASSSELILCGLQMQLQKLSKQNSHTTLHSPLDSQVMNPQHHYEFPFAADRTVQRHPSPQFWTDDLNSDQSSSTSASSNLTLSQNTHFAKHQHAFQSLNNWTTIQEMLDLISPPQHTPPEPWLLYHIGCIKLHADISALQTIFCCVGESKSKAETQAAERIVFSWASNPAAKVALHHAYKIWHLVEGNVQQNEINDVSKSHQDRHVLFSISLYYAGIIMRALADLCPEIEVEIWRPENQGVGLYIPRGDIHSVLKDIGAIAPKISLVWEPVSALILETRILSLNPMPMPFVSDPAFDTYEEPDRLGSCWTGNLGDRPDGLELDKFSVPWATQAAVFM
ncbi:hypothetical protein N7471_001768 [Penicillium samsonianum]|uniref:uncharacterized protein n=1 Tax=Penicillium samsonianum TaxID=1882272 RepID=UPI0025498A8D|nr:uncharacterized protein N7471_001768 [Penicillium samsonianum]KAJ6150569.1 hypothetical protein N7471_001768 [Penicillium samsonianum]